jgi:chromosome segregation ATPase
MQKTKDQKKELEERIKELEERANLNFYEIQRHLENLLRFEERTTAGFLEAEKRIAKLEHEPAISAPPKHDEQIKEIASSLEDRIRSIEDIVMLLELEIVKAKEKMEFVPGVPTRLEDQVRTIENKLGSIEKLKVGVPVELAAHEPRLQGLEDRILSLETKLKQETSRLEEILSERLVTEKTANEVGEKLHTEIQEIRRGIEKAEMLRFEITSREKDFAKKSEFESFTNFTHQELENLKDSVDRITASNTTLDRNLIKIEETLRSESDSHKKTFDTQLIKIEEKISDEIDSNKKNYDA